jgi:hypothetical protein
MTSLKYKDKEFTVRENTLGVGKTIAEISAKYEDDLAISQYVIVRLPEYDRYQTIINEISVISADIRDMEYEASKAKGSVKKGLQAKINKAKKDLENTQSQLKEPGVLFIMSRVINIRKEVNFGFINDMEIFKTLCSVILVNADIDFGNIDEDLLLLRDEVFRLFFSIRAKIYE